MGCQQALRAEKGSEVHHLTAALLLALAQLKSKVLTQPTLICTRRDGQPCSPSVSTTGTGRHGEGAFGCVVKPAVLVDTGVDDPVGEGRLSFAFPQPVLSTSNSISHSPNRVE